MRSLSRTWYTSRYRRQQTPHFIKAPLGDGFKDAAVLEFAKAKVRKATRTAKMTDVNRGCVFSHISTSLSTPITAKS